MGDPIVLVDYDPAWPDEFARLRDRAWATIGDLAVSIEHVGSTAVPGLPAKPVVDIVVVISSGDHLPEAIRRLEAIGYRARGELGVPGREAFSWPEGEERHHLYVSPTESEELQAQIAFRDRLRSDPALAADYVELKRELAARFRDDRPAYTDGKADFIAAVLHRQEGWHDHAVTASWSERLKELRPRLIDAFGNDVETMRTVSRVLELMDKAWRDSYGPGAPSDEIVDDVLLCAGGTLPGLVDAAHLAVVDWRDVVVWASEIRGRAAQGAE